MGTSVLHGSNICFFKGAQKSQAFQVVFGVDNVDLHRYLYEQFIHANLGPELIKVRGQSLISVSSPLITL